jgi:hypothetical protein
MNDEVNSASTRSAGTSNIKAMMANGTIPGGAGGHPKYNFLPTRLHLDSTTGSRAPHPGRSTETFRMTESRSLTDSTKGATRRDSRGRLNVEADRPYGYMGIEVGLVIGLRDLLSVVQAVSKEIQERGTFVHAMDRFSGE